MAHISTWQPDKVALLKKLFATTDNDVIAAQLGTTKQAVRSKAFTLGLKKSTRFWSKKDIARMVKEIEKNKSTPDQVAEILGKTRWAIINKYREVTGKRK